MNSFHDHGKFYHFEKINILPQQAKKNNQLSFCKSTHNYNCNNQFYVALSKEQSMTLRKTRMPRRGHLFMPIKCQNRQICSIRNMQSVNFYKKVRISCN